MSIILASKQLNIYVLIPTPEKLAESALSQI